MSDAPIRIMCVDDNTAVAEAVRLKVGIERDLAWAGALSSADRLLQGAQEMSPDIILLDIDMPGRDTFEALHELSAACPDIRVIMLSGYVSVEYIERAIDSGAWGYLSKSDGTDAIIAAVRSVAAGSFSMGPQVLEHYTRSMGSRESQEPASPRRGG